MSVDKMTVRDLIKFLRKQPQNIPVVFKCFSEQCLLESKDIQVKGLCVARPDGWVQNARPDMESIDYLVFPGN